MGVLSKSKLAAKRAALKGVPKSMRDHPLSEIEAAIQKPILVSRIKEIRSLHGNERDERTDNSLPPNLPRPAVNILPVTSKVVETIGVTRGRDRQALRPAKKRKKKAASSASVSSEPNPPGLWINNTWTCATPYIQERSYRQNLPQDALIVHVDT
ncbi:hypothetical protein MBLNU13_g02610t1 [Cladosporium sp. NU13]